MVVDLGASPSIDIQTKLGIKAGTLKSVDCSSDLNDLLTADVLPPTKSLIPEVQATERDSVGPCIDYSIAPITK